MREEQELDSFEAHHRPKDRLYFKDVRVISDQIDREGLELIWETLSSVVKDGIRGDIVELGCYVGTTSLVIRRLLDYCHESDKRTFHVYDSFEGLPEKTKQDISATGVDFKAGMLRVGKKQFIHKFRAADLELPIIHKGWFNQLTATDMPQCIAFAFLDGDFYESIIDSLRLVWPRMAQGGKVVIDDYEREALPGVSRALRDFFQAKPIAVEQRGTRAVIKA